MGQKLSVYLSNEAVEILDKIIQERPLVISLRVNRSTVISDLIVQEGEAYLAKLHLLHEAIKRYSPTQLGAEAKAAALAYGKDKAVKDAIADTRREQANIEEYERFDTLEEYAEKLGVADE